MGPVLGSAVGLSVPEGEKLGILDGGTVGTPVGVPVGAIVGAPVGTPVGAPVVGETLGWPLATVGASVLGL